MRSDIMQKLHHRLAEDSVYQQLLTACTESEANYVRIRGQLSLPDAAALEQYISLCEEMDHRKLTLLLEIADANR